jgi:ABC-type uncharacterized transport system ATPase subunit
MILELQHISKNFGTIPALDKVSLTAEPGSIHGLVGENGAGKSTLMKILTGFITKSSGTIHWAGEEIHIRSPHDASELGIGMLYQEPLDFPQLTVLDNFMTGDAHYLPAQARLALEAMGREFSFSLLPDDILSSLTVGERQQLELLRLVKQGKRVLILDEPTTGISDSQKEALFQALVTLRERGAIIFLVSHKIEDIERLCDRVTVLRQGKVTGFHQRPFTRNLLLADMFDTPPQQEVFQPQITQDGIGVTFHEVTSTIGRCGLTTGTLTIKKGEIVGLAGIDGSGQNTFLKLACGLLKPQGGHLAWSDASCGNVGQGPCLHGIQGAMLPADRLTEGLFPQLSIHEHHQLIHNRDILLFTSTDIERTQAAIATFNIKGTLETWSSQLSGGNQQRLLLSLVHSNQRLVCLENPTRGLDLRASQWTWRYLHRFQEKGTTIIFASPDLEEILAHATRVLVFYSGRITLDKPAKQTNFRELSQAITGPKNHDGQSH